MTQTDPWTIGHLLEWTAAYLREHGAESPRLDAEVLLAHARKCQRIELYTAFNQLADETLRSEFRQLVKRRAEGTPVAYLVGYREFYSLRFQVTPAVLIPRPETEFVVIALLDLVKEGRQSEHPLRLADVGTGSGNLAVTAAVHLPVAHVTAIDISPAALEIAQANARDHGVSQRMTFLEGDLLSGLPPADRFDYIISNPPYIGLRETAGLPRDVVDHEPHRALFGGETGLGVLQRLIVQSQQRLVSGGWLISEISPALREQVLEQVAAQDQFHNTALIEDLGRLPRVLRTQKRAGPDKPSVGA